MRTRAAGALLSIAVSAVATSCTADRATKGADSAAASPPSTTAAATTASVAPTTVTFTATDFAFTGPAQVPAGVVTIRLVNQGKERRPRPVCGEGGAGRVRLVLLRSRREGR